MTIIIFLVASILIMSLLNIISQNEFKREFRNLTSNTNDSIKMYNEKIIEISKENSILKEYRDLFKSYYNDDWNRNTPFAEHIDFIYSTYLISPMKNEKDVGLNTLVKEIETKKSKEEILSDFKRLFGEEFTEILQNIPLGQFFMFSADLKTYQNGTGNFCDDDNTSAEEFLRKAVEHYKIK